MTTITKPTVRYLIKSKNVTQIIDFNRERAYFGPKLEVIVPLSLTLGREKS